MYSWSYIIISRKKKLEWSQIQSFYIVIFAIILMQFIKLEQLQIWLFCIVIFVIVLMQFIICNMICHEWQLVQTFYTVKLSFIFDTIDNVRGNMTWIIPSQTDRVFIYISTVQASITQFVTHGTVWGIASQHGSVMEIHWGIQWGIHHPWWNASV